MHLPVQRAPVRRHFPDQKRVLSLSRMRLHPIRDWPHGTHCRLECRAGAWLGAGAARPDIPYRYGGHAVACPYTDYEFDDTSYRRWDPDALSDNNLLQKNSEIESNQLARLGEIIRPD